MINALSANRSWLLLGLVLCGLIGVFILLPVSTMEILLKPANQWLHHYFPGIGVSAGKIGHAIAFFLLALWAFAISWRQGIHWLRPVIWLMAFAVVTELLQLMISGRTTRLQDLLFDLLGVSVALVLFALALAFTYVWRLARRRQATASISYRSPD